MIMIMKRMVRRKKRRTMNTTKTRAKGLTMRVTVETVGLLETAVMKKVESKTNRMPMKVAWMRMRKETRLRRKMKDTKMKTQSMTGRMPQLQE